MAEDKFFQENCRDLFQQIYQPDNDPEVFESLIQTQYPGCGLYVKDFLRSKVKPYPPGEPRHPKIRSVMAYDDNHKVIVVQLKNRKAPIIMYQSSGTLDGQEFTHFYFPFYGIKEDKSILRANPKKRSGQGIIREFLGHFEDKEEVFVSAYLSGDLDVEEPLASFFKKYAPHPISPRRLVPLGLPIDDQLPFYRVPEGHTAIDWLPLGWTKMDCGGGGDCMFYVIAAIMSERFQRTITMQNVRDRLAAEINESNFMPVMGMVSNHRPFQKFVKQLEKKAEAPTFRWTKEQWDQYRPLLISQIQNLVRQPGLIWGDHDLLSILSEYTDTTFVLFSDQQRIVCGNLSCHRYIAFLYWYEQVHYELVSYNGKSMYLRNEAPQEIKDLLRQQCPNIDLFGYCIPPAQNSYIVNFYADGDKVIIPLFDFRLSPKGFLVSDDGGLRFVFQPQVFVGGLDRKKFQDYPDALQILQRFGYRIKTERP